MNKITVTKKFQFSGHRDGVYRLEQGPEPHLFFSAAGDGMIVLWDLTKPDQGQLIGRMNNSIYALEYWSDKDFLIAGHNYDGIHILDWKNKKEVSSLNFTKAAIFDIKVVDEQAFVATGNGEVVVVNLKQLSVAKRLTYTDQRARSIDFIAERQEIAVGYSDNSLRIFDLDTLELKNEIKEAHTNSLFNIKYAPGNNHLLTCGRDARIKRWNVNEKYSLNKEVVGHMYTINHLTFSPDGQYFVSCSMDKSIKIWDAEEMKLLKVIDKGRHASHGTSVNRLLWTPFNNWLLSASDDHSIAAWEITF
ncbi:MAG: WD40 repeat domain-containing protein [Candidatus Cyclobacteriaceae bacterium M2_1C_046]